MNPSICRGLVSRRGFLVGSTSAALGVIGGFAPWCSIGWASDEGQEMPEWLKYTGLDTFDDSPRKFRSMLSAMGDGERVQLAQSLRMLPAIRKGDFGNYGLPSLEAVRPEELPETFNEVPQEVVLSAIKMKRIPAELISSERIIRELIWVSSSLITYWFKSSDVYYHDLVCWVASKFDVSKDEISGLPTFRLERRILEEMFKRLWEKLTATEREDLLRKIEGQTGQKLQDIAAMATLSGTEALDRLGAYVNLAGYTFYAILGIFLWKVGGVLGGPALPVSCLIAPRAVSVIPGPIGWVAAGILAIAGVVWLTSANPRKTLAFISALHFLKAHHFHRSGLLK